MARADNGADANELRALLRRALTLLYVAQDKHLAVTASFRAHVQHLKDDSEGVLAHGT